MATFQVETKNQVDINRKTRVYFTCHPDDFEKHFRKVCKDIFKTHDCAIYYTEDMTAPITDAEKETDLERNNLFVVPVTLKLLSTPNRAMDDDIPFARSKGIPVLPIMMEPGLDGWYAQPDKFGSLQYLNPYSTDLTAIAYEEKLKKYLEAVLISDALAKRVRDAFDAYIFLSYRKKDRRQANALMRLIHSIPNCRDIAIWFDEFLTPGESFRDTIDHILNDSKLFALLVTSNILEKVMDEDGVEQENFVMATELPKAQKKREEKLRNGQHEGEIVPVKLEDIDETIETILKSRNVPEILDTRHGDCFKTLFLDAVLRNGIRQCDDSPEHTFLMGLAYLEGIDVEVDRQRGVELITAAADAGLLEANEKLRDMYCGGIAVERNYTISLSLCEKIVSMCEERFGAAALETAAAYAEWATLAFDLGDYDLAMPHYKHAYEITETVLGEKHPDTRVLLNNYAAACFSASRCFSIQEEVRDGHTHMNFERQFPIAECIPLFEKLYALQVEADGEDAVESLLILCYLVLTYSESDEHTSVASAYRQQAYTAIQNAPVRHRDYITCVTLLSKAFEYVDPEVTLRLCRLAYAVSCTVFGAKSLQTSNTLQRWADACKAFCHVTEDGEDSENEGHYRQALQLLEDAYFCRCEVLGENHISTLDTLMRIADVYWLLDEKASCLEVLQNIYLCRQTVFGRNAPQVLDILELMANTMDDSETDPEKKLPVAEHIYAICCELHGEQHKDTLRALQQLAVAYSDCGDLDTARSLHEKHHQLACVVFGDDSDEAAQTRLDLANCYYRHSKYDLAAAVCQDILDHPRYAEGYKRATRYLLAKIYYCYRKKKQSLALCDQLQQEGHFQDGLPTSIQTIAYWEATNYTLDADDDMDPDYFEYDYDMYLDLLKVLQTAESHEPLGIGAHELNQIRAAAYDHMAYYCRHWGKCADANLFYSLAAMLIIFEARSTSDVALYTAAIDYLKKVADFFKSLKADNRATTHTSIQHILQQERDRILNPHQEPPAKQPQKIMPDAEKEPWLEDVLSELATLFKQLYPAKIYTGTEWIFKAEYEEDLLVKLVEDLFQRGLASTLREENANTEITITRSEGDEEVYSILDTFTWDGQTYMLLSSPQEDQNIAIAKALDTTTGRRGLLCSIDKLLSAFYKTLM